MITEIEQGVILSVHIQPGASKNQISGLHNGALKIRIHSPPVDGKANETLIEFLSKFFGLPKRNFEIISGEKGRAKRLQIIGLKKAELEMKLAGTLFP